MLVHGVQRRDSYGRYRFAGKIAVKATSATPSIPASSQGSAQSTGIKFTLFPRQAIYIRRYECFATDIASTGALFANGGEFEVTIAPFATANGILGYPLMEALAVPQALTSGQLLTPIALVFALIDEWFEWDDVITDQSAGIFQMQSIWSVANLTAGAKNVTVQERVTYDFFDGVLTDA